MEAALSAQSAGLTKRPVEFLLDVFRSRRERNGAYSISAFARDLGVSISLLSRIFSGTRPMTLKFALQISEALNLTDAELNQLSLSILATSSKNAKISKKVRSKLEKHSAITARARFFADLEVERFRAMANWHHLAVLNLASLDDFDPQPMFIARRLGITRAEARDALERLIGVGLLAQTPEGGLKRTSQNLYVKTHRSEFAVRNFHKQMIQKASEELSKTSKADFSKRLINGITFACGPEHLELIKDKIDRFQDEILAVTRDGVSDSVYQLNVQFFPLTRTKKVKGEPK